ncbi:MAG: cupin domain-containing protein [Myxococcales bacterium]|nr:cupin domain-containing protein [Myxococcales bacterium]
MTLPCLRTERAKMLCTTLVMGALGCAGPSTQAPSRSETTPAAKVGEAQPAAEGTPIPDRIEVTILRLTPSVLHSPPFAQHCGETFLYVTAGKASVTGTDRVDLAVGDAVRLPRDTGVILGGDGTVVVFRVHGSTPGPCHEHGLEGPRSTSNAVEHRNAGGKLRVTILFEGDGQPLAGGLSVLRADRDFAVPEHTHEASDETLYILGGEGTMRVGTAEIAVAPGRVIHVPRGTVHDLRPRGTQPLHALQVYSPSGPEQRFKNEDTPSRSVGP